MRRTLGLRRELLPGAGETALVAVSGGADSVALLLAMRELGCRPVVAHLDHGLRPESGQDAQFVRELATRLEAPCIIERRRTPATEAGARASRYAFLREVAEKTGAAAIFLGHTADDQVETFLLRLIRGAGPAGLSGMQPVRGDLRRPLLGVWRGEVEDYLRARGQPWREDASNQDPRYLRNRVRHELLPLLASMNPGIKQVLLRQAAQQRDVHSECLRQLGLNGRQIAAARSGKPVTLPGGWRLEPPAEEPEPFDIPLPVPGRAHIPGIGAVCAGEEGVPVNVCGPLRVRSRRPGDWFCPAGMGGHRKKLQDFLVDAHIPRTDRDRIPLVLSGSDIVWVVGMRIDERFKVTADSPTVVRLSFEREP